MNSDAGPKQAETPQSTPDQPKAAAPRNRTIGGVLLQLIREIDSLAETFPLAMVAISGASRAAREKQDTFLSERGLKVDEESGMVQIPVNETLAFRRVAQRVARTTAAHTLVPRSIVVSFVSQFDAFLGRLIETLYLAQPELLNGSEKALSFSELTGFESIQAARDHVLEKEIESILRKSHAEQFDWLEKKFDVPLRKDLPIWPQFIEITERRNLFVHTAGQVSAQYLQVCAAHKVDCKGVKRGKFLDARSRYISQTHETIFEIAVKLAHVLWRKVQPKDRGDADGNLIRISYELLAEQKYDLAKKVLDFATALKKFASTENRLILVINRAQAYKWSGDNTRAQDILAAEDFTALRDKFQLAAAVLRDDFAGAFKIVELIGTSEGNALASYREWPLYRELRKAPGFASLIRKVFGEQLDLVTSVLPDVLPSEAVDSPDLTVPENSGEIKLDQIAPSLSSEAVISPQTKPVSTGEKSAVSNGPIATN